MKVMFEEGRVYNITYTIPTRNFNPNYSYFYLGIIKDMQWFVPLGIISKVMKSKSLAKKISEVICSDIGIVKVDKETVYVGNLDPNCFYERIGFSSLSDKAQEVLKTEYN